MKGGETRSKEGKHRSSVRGVGNGQVASKVGLLSYSGSPVVISVENVEISATDL